MISAWGFHLILDLFNCDSDRISDREVLSEFASQSCKILGVKAYGEPLVEWFGKGETEGFTLVQLIETSLISGHFAVNSNSAYIDIFSCAPFDPVPVKEFTQAFFKARKVKMTYLVRGEKYNEI